MSNTENKLIMFGHEHVIECCTLAPHTAYQYLAPLAGIKESAATSTAEFMATGSRDKTIKLWDARGNCLKTLIGHDNWVRAIAFHPGGKYLLSVSDDRTLRCWDLSQEGRCVKTLADAHERFITCLRWCPGIIKDASAVPNNNSNNNNNAAGNDSKNQKNKAKFPDVQIRCIIATGSVDWKLKIFAN